MTGKCIIFLTLLTFSSCDERNCFGRNSYSTILDGISLENTESVYSRNTTDVEVLQTFLFEGRNFTLFSGRIPFASIGNFCIEQGIQMAKTTSGEETARLMTSLNQLLQFVPIDISEWEENIEKFFEVYFDHCGNSSLCFYEFSCSEKELGEKCFVTKLTSTDFTNPFCEWEIPVDMNTTEESTGTTTIVPTTINGTTATDDTTTIVPTTINGTTATDDTTTEPATTDSSNESTTSVPVENRLNIVEEKIDDLNERITSLDKNLQSLNESRLSDLKVSNDLSSKINGTNDRITKLDDRISRLDSRTTQTVIRIESWMESFNKSIQSLNDSISSVSEVLQKNISDLSNQQKITEKGVQTLEKKVDQLSNQTKSFELKLGTIKNELRQALYHKLYEDIEEKFKKSFDESVMSYKTMVKKMNQTFIKHSDRVNSRYNSFTIPVIVFTILLIIVNLISIFYAQRFNNQIAMKENARRKKRISFEPVAVGHNVVNHPGYRRVVINSSEMEKSRGNKRVSFKPFVEMIHSRDKQSESMIQLIKMTSKRENGKGKENETNSPNDDCITFQEVDLNGTSREDDGTIVDSISRP